MSRFDALNDELLSLKILVQDLSNKSNTDNKNDQNKNPKDDEPPEQQDNLDVSFTKIDEQSFASIEEFMEDVSNDQSQPPLNCYALTNQL